MCWDIWLPSGGNSVALKTCSRSCAPGSQGHCAAAPMRSDRARCEAPVWPGPRPGSARVRYGSGDCHSWSEPPTASQTCRHRCVLPSPAVPVRMTETGDAPVMDSRTESARWMLEFDRLYAEVSCRAADVLVVHVFVLRDRPVLAQKPDPPLRPESCDQPSSWPPGAGIRFPSHAK